AANCKDEALRNRRSSARAGPSHAGIEPRLIAVDPHELAIREAIADNAFLLAALLLRDGVLSHNGERTPAGAYWLTPHFAWRGHRPFRRQSDIGKHARAVWSKKL